MYKGERDTDERLEQWAEARTPGHNEDFGLYFKCSGEVFKSFRLGKVMDR